MVRIILAAALLLTACAPRGERAIAADYQPYIGQTLAVYMRNTGSSPRDAYDGLDGRRSFLFGTRGCSITLTARPTHAVASPEAWTIEQINTVGAC